MRFPRWEGAAVGVPDTYTQPWIPDHVELRRVGGVCTAHHGEVGVESTCGIYDHRPVPCRVFTASWANGERNESCDRARQQIGLPPLPRP